MKKRIISLFLAVIMLISAIPFASAEEVVIDADAQYTTISTYAEFLDFLDNAYNFGDLEYYRLSADITADGNVIGEYNMNNIVFDGNGHKITGLNIENALFESINGSYFRNVTFENATVTGYLSGNSLDVAVLSQSTSDSFITNLVFSGCNVIIPSEGSIYAAFVSANNEGNITNCIIDSNCSITADTSYADPDAEILIGGIAAYNSGDAVVTNCISKMKYTSADGPLYSLGGIVAENRAVVTYCYSAVASSDTAEDFGYIYAIAGGDYYNQFHVHKEDGKFNVTETGYTKDYSAMDVLEFAAEMSETVMNDNTNNLYGKRPDEDLPALWSVENGDLWLSFDGKTGQVYFSFAEDIADNIKNNGIAKNSNPDIKSVSYYFCDTNNTKEVIPGKKFSVRVGNYSGGNYVRNYVDLHIRTTDYKVVNAVISKPLQSYVKNMDNTFDGVEGTYSDMLFAPVITYNTTDAVCNAKINIYPFCTSAGLSNVSSFDEIRYLMFKGEGTESNPFEIGSAYELMAFSHYVNYGLSFGSLKYNEASYVLTADIDLNYADFNPIGSYSSDGSTAFKGHFNGQGHYIRNLRIITTNSYTGFFGIVKGTDTQKAVLENITIHGADVADADINNKADIKGVLVAQAEHATIRGCVAMGDISGGTFIGGLAGYTYHTDIINCGTDVNAYSYHQWTRLGGIVGNAEYTNIINSYTLSNPHAFQVIDESYVDVGIIAGRRLETNYEHCYYDNMIPSFSYSDMNASELSNIYSKYGMTTRNFMDELIYYSAVNGYETTFTQSEYGKTIPVASNDAQAQYIAMCASTSAGPVKFVYYPTETWHKFKSGSATVFVESGSDKELKDIIIKDFNGNTVDVDYKIEDGVASFRMPYFSVKIYPSFTEPYLDGDGTEADPYRIASYDDLVFMAKQINENNPDEKYRDGYYLVVNDIDCDYNEIPVIGLADGDKAYEHAFRGTFDGNGNKIYNGIIKTTTAYAGMFYALEGAEIRDVYFENLMVLLPSSVTADFKAAFIAANVVHSDEPTKFVNISINKCFYSLSSPLNGISSTSSFSFLANNVVSDVEFINCLFKNSNMRGSYVDEIKNKVFLCGVYDSYAQITAKNVLALDYLSDFALLYNANPGNIAESENVYHTYLIENDTFLIHKLIAEFVVFTYATSYEFEDIMNDYAKNNLMSYEPAVWSSINDETDIILGISDDISFDYNIIYDDVFTTNETKLIDMEYAPSEARAGKEVSICYYADADVSNLSVKTESGKDVPFTTDLAYQEAQFGVIRFTMPWEDVIITINSKEIEPILMEGIGTEEDPYVMTRREHLVLVANVINGFTEQYKPSAEYVDYDKAYYIIERDIDMTGVTWDGIGTSDVYFSGQIDGQGNYIKFLNKNSIRPDGKNAGLFTRLKASAVIKNLKLEEAYVYITDTYHNAAGAFAMLNYGRIEKCMLFNLSMKNDGLTNAGAIAGRNLGMGIIENCAVINSSVTDASTGNSGSYIAYFNQSSIGNCFIYDCVWNSTACDIAVEGGIKPERIYYNMEEAQSDTDSYSVYKSNEVFASGEVTYLLNNAYALKENVWRQNLPGFEPIDKYPMLETTHRVVDFIDDAGYYNRQDIQSTRYAMVGDINVDGMVQADDLNMLNRFFKRSTAIKLRGMIAADINADGILDKNDYDILENYVRTGAGEEEYSIGTQLPIVYRMPVNALFIADLNGNFEVTEEDYRLHEEYLAIADTLDDDMRIKLDINLDGELNAIDTECIILYLDAAAAGRSYGGFTGKVGYIGEEIDFEKQPVIPEEPEEDEDDKEDEIPEDDKDDAICDSCGSDHENFIIRIFCFFTKFFVTLFTLLGIW